MMQFDEPNKKLLICRGCAGRTLGYEKSCCQENKFINVLKQHYVDGVNINELKEMLDLTQGCENFCEQHGYLYEFILTKKHQQFRFEDQILYCKKCIQEEKNLNSYDIQLLNEDYFTFPIQNQQNQNPEEKTKQEQEHNIWNQNKLEMEKKINEVFKKMQVALKEKVDDKTKLQSKIQQAEKRKYEIEQMNQITISQQSQIQNNNEEQNTKIKNLKLLKEALEVRIKAIANLEDGYHDYLHDEFLEGESIRKKLLEDDSQTTRGYSINDCFKKFDDIQYI